MPRLALLIYVSLACTIMVALSACSPSTATAVGDIQRPVGAGLNESDLTAPADSATQPLIADRIRLGVAPGRPPGQTPIEALINAEQIAGRQFEITRVYAFWDDEFPDLRHQWARDGGRMLHLSVNARRIDGTLVPWETIATAQEGDPVYTELIGWIDRLSNYPAPLRVTFHHEADIEPEFGTPADFIAAWQRFVTLLDDAAPEIETVWVTTAFSMNRASDGTTVAEQFWPGEDFVDLIGADAFNWFGCRGAAETWRSPAAVLKPLIDFGRAFPDKALVLAELGSDEDDDDPARKSAWLDELARLVDGSDDQYGQLETIIFFHNDHDDRSTCDWWLDSSEPAAAAMQRLALLPRLGGDTAPAPPEQCPAVTMTTSTPDDVALVDGDGDGRFDFDFGTENRFLGVGEQTNDGSDHRVVLRFPPLGELPDDSTVELRIRVGERQPALFSPIELHLIPNEGSNRDLFGETIDVIDSDLFDSTTPGGHHTFDVTDQIDPSQPVTLRMQPAETAPADGTKAALFIGMGEATRSIDRPALIARSCG